MANIVDFLRLDIGADSRIYLPKTVARAVYTTDDTSISGSTLDQFINRHQHDMRDIRDLNIGDDGNLILKPLTILFNGAKLLDYDGISPQTIDFSLNSLGAAGVSHNHDLLYSKLSHTHSGYATVVHTHAVSDIVDLGDISGGGDIQPLRIQFSGFDKLTFDGKTTKTLNITAAEIGAAEASHTHAFSNITDVALPTLQILGKNSIPIGNYNGSVESNIHITPQSIDAAPTMHEHKIYALFEHDHDIFYANIQHYHQYISIPDRPKGLDSGYVQIGAKKDTTVGLRATAEGYNTTASAMDSHAEGVHTTASGDDSHAEGYSTIASGQYSHAEGSGTTASGQNCHAEGRDTVASGYYSHAGGLDTIASGNSQMAIGYANVPIEGSGPGDSVFIAGVGYQDQDTMLIRKNMFRISKSGIYGAAAFTSSGADYGEYFEWDDLNINNEDRIGYFVTCNEDKIALANAKDYIVGNISGTASVIGNGYEDQWNNMDLRDVWGRLIWEDYAIPEEYYDGVNQDGSIESILVSPAESGKRPKSNPGYDQSKPYIPRSQRPEWDVVGMMGVLTVRDDGTCKPNLYCKVIDGGIASASDKGYRVLKRVADNVIKILFRGEDNPS